MVEQMDDTKGEYEWGKVEGRVRERRLRNQVATIMLQIEALGKAVERNTVIRCNTMRSGPIDKAELPAASRKLFMRHVQCCFVYNISAFALRYLALTGLVK